MLVSVLFISTANRQNEINMHHYGKSIISFRTLLTAVINFSDINRRKYGFSTRCAKNDFNILSLIKYRNFQLILHYFNKHSQSRSKNRVQLLHLLIIPNKRRTNGGNCNILNGNKV